MPLRVLGSKEAQENLLTRDFLDKPGKGHRPAAITDSLAADQ